MKKLNTKKQLKTGLKFLEAVKVQLENRDLLAVSKSISEYGLLVPNSNEKETEQKRFKSRMMTQAQIGVIQEAIVVIKMLLKKTPRRTKSRKKSKEQAVTQVVQ